MITIRQATVIIETELRSLSDLGYKIEKRPSQSTNSCYFKITNRYTSMIFRISDHKTHKNIMTLRLDKENSEETVKKFVRNRIKDFNRRSCDTVLGLRHA